MHKSEWQEVIRTDQLQNVFHGLEPDGLLGLPFTQEHAYRVHHVSKPVQFHMRSGSCTMRETSEKLFGRESSGGSNHVWYPH